MHEQSAPGSDSHGHGSEPCHVLLADDDHWVAEIYSRILECNGFTVQRTENGADAIEQFSKHAFDVVIASVEMPGANGIDVLQAVHTRDADLPVILMTGNPELASSVKAVEHGALRYLFKPVDLEQLTKVVRDAVQKHRMLMLEHRAFELHGHATKQLGSRQALELHLESALRRLYTVYQPIVEPATRRVFAYEALLRSPDDTLHQPDRLRHLAKELGRTLEIGRAVRDRVASTLSASSEPATIFVNLHPHDLEDDELYAADAPLSRVAERVVLGITERAAQATIGQVTERVKALRALGFRLAIDDLGGYAGLGVFAQVRPEVAKLDVSLIRDIDRDLCKRKVVACLTLMGRELGVHMIGEGVETVAERDTLLALGCELLQGDLFARPAWPIPQVSW